MITNIKAQVNLEDILSIILQNPDIDKIFTVKYGKQEIINIQNEYYFIKTQEITLEKTMQSLLDMYNNNILSSMGCNILKNLIIFMKSPDYQKFIIDKNKKLLAEYEYKKQLSLSLSDIQTKFDLEDNTPFEQLIDKISKINNIEFKNKFINYIKELKLCIENKQNSTILLEITQNIKGLCMEYKTELNKDYQQLLHKLNQILNNLYTAYITKYPPLKTKKIPTTGFLEKSNKWNYVCASIWSFFFQSDENAVAA